MKFHTELAKDTILYKNVVPHQPKTLHSHQALTMCLLFECEDMNDFLVLPVSGCCFKSPHHCFSIRFSRMLT